MNLASAHFELTHGLDGRGYATRRNGTRAETYRIRTTAFRDLLAGLAFRTYGKAVSAQATEEALRTLEAMGLHDGSLTPVHIRLAEHEGAIYLDLCDDSWRVVRIDAAGWAVAETSPVRFIRRRGMLPLPRPTRANQSLDGLLRPHLNVTDETWPLVVGWLLSALRPDIPYPQLHLFGEQGCGKSTAARVLRGLIDPNRAPLRSPPRNLDDLAIAAANSWIIVFDNLSRISPDLSDALCRLSTGGGSSKRELWENDEEVILEARRPVIVTGIEEVATRADLLDRALLVELRTIGENERRDETSYWQAVSAAHPAILGALLDNVSTALRRLPSVHLGRLPRMADAARWVTAAEPALDWPDGTWLTIETRNRRTAHSVAIEASLVACRFIEWVGAQTADWAGTMSDLLALLNHSASEQDRQDRSWPRNANALGGTLKRLGPLLRAQGIEVTHEPRTSARRIVRVTIPEQCRNGASSASSCREPADRLASHDGRDEASQGDSPKGAR